MITSYIIGGNMKTVYPDFEACRVNTSFFSTEGAVILASP